MANLITVRGNRKNPLLAPGIHRFGRSKMYHKRGLFWKKNIRNLKKVRTSKPVFVEKPVGGSSNGSVRKVLLKKSKKYHPTATSDSKRNTTTQKRILNGRISVPKLRGSLVPGSVVILLAGRHAGKRVVFLKQLKSGLLLVTGPFKLNGVPIRRVHQQYVVATSTRLDITGLEIPGSLNDSFFRRDKKAIYNARRRQLLGGIFVTEKFVYEPSNERKTSQSELDKKILNVIKANKEKKMLCKYLASPFQLKSGQYPHRMKF